MPCTSNCYIDFHVGRGGARRYSNAVRVKSFCRVALHLHLCLENDFSLVLYCTGYFFQVKLPDDENCICLNMLSISSFTVATHQSCRVRGLCGCYNFSWLIGIVSNSRKKRISASGKTAQPVRETTSWKNVQFLPSPFLVFLSLSLETSRMREGREGGRKRKLDCSLGS